MHVNKSYLYPKRLHVYVHVYTHVGAYLIVLENLQFFGNLKEFLSVSIQAKLHILSYV